MLYYALNAFASPGLATVSGWAATKKGFNLSASTLLNADEHALLDAAIAGSDEAYTIMVERYHSLMVAVAAAIVGPSLAEDVAQDAWFSAHRALTKFERRASLKTWLLRIVSNEAITRAKRESRHIALDCSPSDSSYLDDERFSGNGHWARKPSQWHLDTPDALMEEVDLHRCINKTLLLLPPQQRAAFRLRDIEQATFEDISQWLGVSAANARVLVHRARLTLLDVIDHYQETGQC
ncbi:RNA polymerase sigma factor [Gilvimarinus sp. SDUM040013]|uniref:RNA polymerase sigma factor n=1 Tax=Gilvimarinus gilvus TaxID=3058038 RepID=A0ABU4RTA8_9GAMM|nr:RNA polymerase sigma factor [Gilvimarinus sp. SDUM040013]MDO3386979.1 RNA polymerase sigma factor [Gilvimarinus sp. SDUM040013]MDX6848127.1 RNA polymerase sigma factor [Gilvimarinus sp. SDUM040013]